MTEPETRVQSEGDDEESIVSEAIVSEAPQVEVSAPVVAPGIPRKEAVGSDSNAEPCSAVLVTVTEQAPTLITKETVGVTVGVTDELKKGSIPEKEEGRKEMTIEQEKGSNPSTNARRRPARKKKVAGNDSNAEPARTVPVKAEEQASAIMIMDSEDKAGEGGNKEQAAKGVAVDEGTKEGALSNRASRTHKRKKTALAVATTSAAATAEATKDNEEKSAVADKVESALSKDEGEREEVPDERNKPSALNKKAKRLQKMKTAASANAETAKDNKEKTDVADKVEGALSEEEGTKEVVLDEGEKASTLSKKVKSLQEMETTALTIATTSAAITAQTANDNSEKEVADKDKLGRSLSKKNRKKKNKARVAASEAAGAAEVGDVKNLSVAKEHAGMIFMCNAETKRDCYRYKVFGMPAGKKETVAKVYKGMKLFLYDVDLKLLYGIYIATSKGGYNIQPKAFKSGFPSQVRFKVLKDYLPLAEEKFKVAIKANYYKKKKFSLELSAEQVKNLSKLFVEATKSSKRTNGRTTREKVPQNFTSHDSKRRLFQGTVSRRLIDEDDRMFPRSREREGYVSQVPLQVSLPPPGSAVPRQAVLPPYISPSRLPPVPLPPPAYLYERPRDDYYRTELPMEAHGYRVDHVGHNDPYSLHREPAPYHENRYPLILPSYQALPPPPFPY